MAKSVWRDLTSTNSPVTYSSGNPDDYIKFVANPTTTASQVSLNGNYRDARNNVVTGSVTVAPLLVGNPVQRCYSPNSPNGFIAHPGKPGQWP